MFRHQGAGRTDRQNRAVAGYLAFAGGYVNCVGFVLIGTFTSHATGMVGRFGNDLATGELAGAGAALTMILAFFGGAFAASMMIESRFTGRPSNAYGSALTIEAVLLVAFTIVSRLTPWAHSHVKDLEAAVLCAAMGMQNSLVTRLSGAVVRTTHLTGVVTDLGIEAARWFRWWRASLSSRFRVKLSLGRNPAEEPSLPKVA
ncbi:MAG TPA: YoaK family protein, partial [Polyangiaceae bacterium]